MGMSLEADDDPPLSSRQHLELASLLARHSLASCLPSLLARVVETQGLGDLLHLLPKGERDVLLLVHSCSQVIITNDLVVGLEAFNFQVTPRPLPSILHHSFLHSLHDSVKGLLALHPVFCENIPREDIVKMVAGLR